MHNSYVVVKVSHILKDGETTKQTAQERPSDI